MKLMLPHLLCPVLSVSLPLLRFAPVPPLADVAMPWVYFTIPLMIVGFVPIVVIEGLVLRRRLRVGAVRALGMAALANLVSALVGILLSSLELLDWGPRHGHGHGLEFYGPVFFLLFPLLLISVLVEAPIVAGLMRLGRKKYPPVAPEPRQSLQTRWPVARSVFYANVASYVFLALLVAVLLVQDLRRGPDYFEESAYVLNVVRNINTAEVTYAQTYGKGYSPSLAALDGRGNGAPSANAAQLIDADRASGELNYYRFVYAPGPPNAKGEITTYSLSASPIQSGTGARYFFTDETGIIRVNPAHPATASDPPLAGLGRWKAFDVLYISETLSRPIPSGLTRGRTVV